MSEAPTIFYFFLSEDEEGLINGAFVSKVWFDAWACIESEHQMEGIRDRLPDPEDWDEIAEAMFMYEGFHDVATLRTRLEAEGMIWNEEIVNG